jgi:UDP-N-acetylmuramyl pentapeptide phosphotransferase/UDP-N-acetylglucosamine-1-phosphate transferase
VISAGHDWQIAAAIAAGSGLLVFALMKPLIAWLRRRAIMDIPNDRSSHVEITPRGGGVVVTAGVMAGLVVWFSLWPNETTPIILLGMAALAIVSWLDDRLGGLPVGFRLGAQMLSIGVVLATLPMADSVTHSLVPVWLERIVLFFAWVWFTNLFNFMDGINGITGVEMVTIGVGAAVVVGISQAGGDAAAPGLIVAAAALGFLPWNWGKAKVFLGDVGSIPAGYLLGGMLLALALAGHWAAALILPMYYWVDATFTLLRRGLRGEKVWQAHRSHFYQQGARKLGSHAAAATRIAALNLLLIVLAAASSQGWQVAIGALVTALGATIALCRYFAEPAQPLG